MHYQFKVNVSPISIRNLRSLLHPDPELDPADVNGRGNFHQIILREGSNSLQPLKIVVQADSDAELKICFEYGQVIVISNPLILERE